MTQQTLGPWSSRSLKRSIEVFAPEAGNAKIASIPLNQFTDNARHRADTALIMAAPKLLATLKAFVEHYAGHKRSQLGTGFAARWYDAAITAIAEAEKAEFHD